MTKLSVNINKIATLRNARGGNNPNVLTVARDVALPYTRVPTNATFATRMSATCARRLRPSLISRGTPSTRSPDWY